MLPIVLALVILLGFVALFLFVSALLIFFEDLTMKKSAKHKPIKLPVHRDHPALHETLEEIPIVPTPVEPETLPAHDAPPVTIACIATSYTPWWGGEPYIVLSAADGSALPQVPETGMLVDVCFAPPAPPAPPQPPEDQD